MHNLIFIFYFLDEGDESAIQNFSRTESQIIWEEEHEERERQRKEVALLYKQDNGNIEKEEKEEEEEEEDWEGMLDEQLQWQNSESTKPLEDLQQKLDSLRHLAERKPPSVGISAMSTIEPAKEEQKEEIMVAAVKEEPKINKRVEEPIEDGATPVASDEEEVDLVENVRGEGEGREADPVVTIPREITPPNDEPEEEDPFAPLTKSSSDQSELLQEVLSARTSLTNGMGTEKMTTVSSKQMTNNSGTWSSSSTENQTRLRQFSTPNARVISLDFSGEETTDDAHGGWKVKAVQKTRWTPEMKENRKVTPVRSQSLAMPRVTPQTTPQITSYYTPNQSMPRTADKKMNSFSRGGAGGGARGLYEKHEVVVTDVRGRSSSYGAPEEHKMHHVSDSIMYMYQSVIAQLEDAKLLSILLHDKALVNVFVKLSI